MLRECIIRPAAAPAGFGVGGLASCPGFPLVARRRKAAFDHVDLVPGDLLPWPRNHRRT